MEAFLQYITAIDYPYSEVLSGLNKVKSVDKLKGAEKAQLTVKWRLTAKYNQIEAEQSKVCRGSILVTIAYRKSACWL